MRSLGRVGAMAAACLAALVSVAISRAFGEDDEPAGPGLLAEGRDLRFVGKRAEGKAVVEEYDGDGGRLYVVRPEGGAPFAYRVDAETAEGGAVSLDLVVVTAAGETATEGLRVAHGEAESAEVEAAAAKSLLDVARAAEGDWAAATSPPALSGLDDPKDVEAAQWRAVARALEKAREKHPKHLGILRNLIVAYSRVLPSTAGTPQALTVSALLPKRIAQFEGSVPSLRPDESREFRLALAGMYLQEGRYPLVLSMTGTDESVLEDPEVAAAIAAVGSTFHVGFEAREGFVVEGALGNHRVTPWESPGDLPDGTASFSRWTYIVAPEADPDVPSRFWYALVAQRSTSEASPRWALYACVGPAKRAIRLYGDAEPDAETAAKHVREHLAAALSPKGGGK